MQDYGNLIYQSIQLDMNRADAWLMQNTKSARAAVYVPVWILFQLWHPILWFYITLP